MFGPYSLLRIFCFVMGDHAKVVRDEKDRRTVPRLEVGDEVEDLRLYGDVERRRRLVGDRGGGVAGQCDRDHDALAHPAGELVHPPRRGRDPHLPQKVDRLGPHLRRAHGAVAKKDLADLSADGHDGIEGRHRLLENDRHPVAANVLIGALREADQFHIAEADTA